MSGKGYMSRPTMAHAVADTVSSRLPKSVSPRTHALADYAVVGMFALAGGLFWKTNRKAAIAALLCGGASLAVNLATDYPGGVVKLLPFRKHEKIDRGLSALTATMPQLLGFRHGRWFFLTQAGAITVTGNLTQFRAADYPPARSSRYF